MSLILHYFVKFSLFWNYFTIEESRNSWKTYKKYLFLFFTCTIFLQFLQFTSGFHNIAVTVQHRRIIHVNYWVYLHTIYVIHASIILTSILFFFPKKAPELSFSFLGSIHSSQKVLQYCYFCLFPILYQCLQTRQSSIIHVKVQFQDNSQYHNVQFYYHQRKTFFIQ